MKHVATILCEFISKGTDDRYTLGGIYRNMQARSLPTVKDPFNVYVEVEGEEGENFEIWLEGPEDFKVLLMQTHLKAVRRPSELVQGSNATELVARPGVFGAAGIWAIVVRTGESGEEEVHRHTFGVLPPVGPVEHMPVTPPEGE